MFRKDLVNVKLNTHQLLFLVHCSSFNTSKTEFLVLGRGEAAARGYVENTVWPLAVRPGGL